MIVVLGNRGMDPGLGKKFPIPILTLRLEDDLPSQMGNGEWEWNGEWGMDGMNGGPGIRPRSLWSWSASIEGLPEFWQSPLYPYTPGLILDPSPRTLVDVYTRTSTKV